MENEIFDFDAEILRRDAKIETQAQEILILKAQIAELQIKLTRKGREVAKLTEELDNQEK